MAQRTLSLERFETLGFETADDRGNEADRESTERRRWADVRGGADRPLRALAGAPDDEGVRAVVRRRGMSVVLEWAPQ